METIEYDRIKEKKRVTDFTLFIVDDNHTYLNLLKDKFSKNPRYNIFTFTSGEDCLEKLYLNPDLVILDFHLSEGNHSLMDGDKVLEEIKQRKPSVKVMMISGDRKVQLLASDFTKIGATDFIEKNIKTFTRIKIYSNKLLANRNRRFISLLTLVFLLVAGIVLILIFL